MPSNPATTIRIETLLEHEPFVRSILRGLVTDENQVQDLVQETWVRALRRPPKEAGAIKGWLARVAKNLVRDSHRRSATRTHRENTVSRPEADNSAASSEERLRLHQQIVDAVMSLQEPYRGVMILTYYEDLSASEIATKLDRKPATVRSQIHRAHENMRSQLDADYGNRNGWMLVAAPMLKWEKPVVATATGFTFAQIASYAAIAACLVATGLWVESLLSNPASDADESIDGEGAVVLQMPADGASGSMGSATSSKSSEGTNEDNTAVGSGNATGAALEVGSTDQERTLPLMDWSVLVTQDGKPVEGAEVFVRMEEEDMWTPRFGVNDTWYGCMPWADPKLQKMQTGADGRATYTLPGPPKVVWAFSGSGLAGKAVEMGSGSEEVLELSPAFAIYVQVVDRKGDPVSGVPIVFQMFENPEGMPYDTSGDSLHYDIAWTPSGRDGRALFYGLGELGGALVGGEKGRTQNYTVRLGIPGLANKTHRVGPKRGSSIEAPLRLVKPDLGSLNVRVVEPGGELTTRVGRVQLRKSLKYHMNGEVQSYAKVVDGVAHFPMVAAGSELALTFSSPVTGVEWSAVVKGLDPGNELGTRKIQGVSAPTIRGRLTGDPGPFPGINQLPLTLYLLGVDRSVLQRSALQARADGAFEVAMDPGVEVGTLADFQIVGEFRTSEDSLHPRWDLGECVALSENGVDLVEVPLQWIPDRIVGRVVDSNGKGIPDVNITARRDRDPLNGGIGALIQKDGSFEITSVFAKNTLLKISHKNGWILHQEVVPVADGKPLEIVIPIGTKCTGTLIAPEMHPYQYGMIRVHPEGATCEEKYLPFVNVTRDDGQFSIDGIQPGKARVVVILGDYPLLEIQNVQFVAGEECMDPRVRNIDVTDLLQTRTYRLLDEEGATLRGVSLRISVDGTPVAHARSDSSGNALVCLPKVDGLRAIVSAPGFLTIGVDLAKDMFPDSNDIQMSKGLPVRLICSTAPKLAKEDLTATTSLGLLDENGAYKSGNPTVHLPQALFDRGEAQVTFPASGRYALLLAVNRKNPSVDFFATSGVTRCTFSNFILEVKESDAGKTLDLVLPGDLFQGQ